MLMGGLALSSQDWELRLTLRTAAEATGGQLVVKQVFSTFLNSGLFFF